MKELEKTNDLRVDKTQKWQNVQLKSAHY